MNRIVDASGIRPHNAGSTTGTEEHGREGAMAESRSAQHYPRPHRWNEMLCGQSSLICSLINIGRVHTRNGALVGKSLRGIGIVTLKGNHGISAAFSKPPNSRIYQAQKRWPAVPANAERWSEFAASFTTGYTLLPLLSVRAAAHLHGHSSELDECDGAAHGPICANRGRSEVVEPDVAVLGQTGIGR